MQKAEIVELVQKRFPDKNTLAIGDGFNDVSMLLEA
jgi:P-type E1-E2 ATPase